MTVRLKKHLLYYLGLLLMQGIGLVLMLFTASSKQMQLGVVCFMTLLYIIWSVMHHYLHHNLTIKIVIEYILIGSLGMVATIFFLHLL